ncbi:MAG: hypothetical protein IT281_01295 [Ignavibacteria bacterium]|nr:DUF6029 family protein [Ignavibacteria bacterium]MCC7158156.1 hypothetical protein [Ignavibacteria bacterium]
MLNIKGAVKLAAVILFFVSGFIYSQPKLNIKVSASNILRYGNGKETSVSGEDSKKYFEELADVRLFVNDFLAGVRYEYDDPIEFGKSLKGISRRFLEFKKDDFTVRAGNFYEVFSSGLTLNAFESRPIGWNTEFDGGKFNYKTTFGKKGKIKFDGTILGGGMNFTDISDTSRVEEYSIRAGNFSVSPFKPLIIGGSYLYTEGKIPTGNIITDISAEIFEGNLGLSHKGFNLFVSYANKVTISEPNSVYSQSKAPRGDGAYGSLSYTREGFGITVDYKNYRFNVVTPDNRSSTDPFKSLPFQNAPSCIKVYSSTLLSRFPHNVDFNDEVGWQVDAFYSPNDKLTLNANASLTSRHYDYRDIDTSIYTKYERIERSSAFLPSTKNEFSPYWELFLEAEYYVNKNLKTKLGVSRKTNILYSIVDPNATDIVRATTIPLEVQYTFGKVYGVKLNAEFQSAYNSLRAGEKNFWSQLTTLSISRSPNLIISGTVESTNDEEDPSGKKLWAKGELTFKFSSSNTIMLSYGSERGGLQCSSGICRYVNPFNGFRLTLINNYN